MAISSDYPQPVYVNGFSCKNCTDVENARKHIDPAHPKSGPFGVNADTDPSRNQAVTLGGRLSSLEASSSSASATSLQAAEPGRRLNVTA
ncbi:hypothetical protein [Asticcacaulis sp. AC402]|uniref:hypothetical protein n=1 Tax=Asticcacaulis sp. AC402 TaxID=1282361 RepID=UPI0003C3E822|nr:hypothetical protein [Asticcacaulis sp. AC402]ESQ77697.1 hypothetical protein ABAC402_00785 [Asticcacaulis sp. AC402]